MGKLFTAMMPEHQEFIKKQKMFFVGTAPLHAEGHVNISPKGYDTLRIFSPTEVAYLDLTGSGNETSAHLEENSRITFMFIALEGPPMILRLYGKGRVILPDSEEWKIWSAQFDLLPGTRQIICAELHAVKTSCGFSIPYYSYSGDRDTLKQWAVKKSEAELEKYQQEKNRVSMDGHTTTLGQKAAD
jgi:hypothetical protein